MSRMYIAILVLGAATWMALIALAGAFGFDYIHPDAVAYIRIAGYYLSGRFDLAVSGYWGPAFSWLIGAILLLVHDPLIALRLALGVSATVFLCGSYFVFHWFEISGIALAAVTVLIALITVPISAVFVTPDLLLAGFVCLGASQLLAPSWRNSTKRQLLTGLLFGLAYLTKAVALPTFFVMLLLVTVYSCVRKSDNARQISRSAFITLLGFALVATPWIVILSLKYGKPVFSTTPRIAHTIIGPSDVERYHPVMRSFSKPEPGRLTQWEDPTNMAYRPWSPFASAAYARHQVSVIGRNVVFISSVLVVFGLAQAALACLLRRFVLPGAKSMAPLLEQYVLAGIILVSICLPYVVGYAEEVRYLIATFPFLLSAAFRPINGGSGWASEDRRRFLLCVALVGSCFVVPQLLYTKVLVSRIRERAGTASSLSLLGKRLKQEELTGVVASNTRDALYLGLYWEQPVLGVVENATVEQLWASDSDFVVATRSSRVVKELDKDTERFENLDTILFNSIPEAGRCCVKVYRRNKKGGT